MGLLSNNCRSNSFQMVLRKAADILAWFLQTICGSTAWLFCSDQVKHLQLIWEQGAKDVNSCCIHTATVQSILQTTKSWWIWEHQIIWQSLRACRRVGFCSVGVFVCDWDICHWPLFALRRHQSYSLDVPARMFIAWHRGTNGKPISENLLFVLAGVNWVLSA